VASMPPPSRAQASAVNKQLAVLKLGFLGKSRPLVSAEASEVSVSQIPISAALSQRHPIMLPPIENNRKEAMVTPTNDGVSCGG
jgi:hypothetical protein